MIFRVLTSFFWVELKYLSTYSFPIPLPIMGSYGSFNALTQCLHRGSGPCRPLHTLLKLKLSVVILCEAIGPNLDRSFHPK
uniref:Putative secreted protein n=1 Tax=Ixodes ricinus TaxID=34613 RepID=A0A6B0TW20_IXORI